jgi:hypothetical protein
MTEKQALSQSLSKENRSDWLIADFLNLEVVDDEDFDIPVRVRDLSEHKAKVALGIAIKYIKSENKKLAIIRELL